MKVVSGLLAAMLIVCVGSPAQPNIEYKLQANDGDVGDWFGSAVAIEGSIAVIGARMDDDIGLASGSAYVFQKDLSGWTQQQKLLANDGAEGDKFGRSVAVSGNYVIASAHQDDNSTGSAYIFFNDGSSWLEQMKVTASDADSNDSFGVSVGISGDYAIVGASENLDFDDSSGSAYIFLRSGTTWTEQAKLGASDAGLDDRFGRSCAISGDYAVVGAFGDDDFGSASGSAYIFRRDGTTWVEEAKLLPSDGTVDDHFGIAVAISGDYVVIGAYTAGGDSAGAAYIFKRDVSGWVEQAKLLPADPGEGDEFGFSVGITPGVAVVGARLDDDNGDATGAAYIFKEDGSNWMESNKLVGSDADSGDEFGMHVAISSTDAIIGAPFARGDVDSAGAAYIYQDITLDVEDSRPTTIPDVYALSQNYPNPFNPSTVIGYFLPEATSVSVTVHDLMGQEVKTLVTAEQRAGEHAITWNGTNNQGESLAGGVYLYRLKTGSSLHTKKMLLLK